MKQVDGLAQDCVNSITNALELSRSYRNLAQSHKNEVHFTPDVLTLGYTYHQISNTSHTLISRQ